ncbi:MAG: hypothetical protein SNH94_06215 [Rikenellaceae bacterium]
MVLRCSVKLFLVVALSAIAATVQAQERSDYQFSTLINDQDDLRLIEVDTTLFRMPITHAEDSYAEATQYYRVSGASRRRGLYYTTAQQVVEPAKAYIVDAEEFLPQNQLTLYGAQSGYRVGLRAQNSGSLDSSWSFLSSLWAQAGRDLFVEGVFSNAVSEHVTLSRRFGEDHFLRVEADISYSMRGLQYGATSEAFDLIGSTYYNPSWGFYDGQVRNSRVRRQFSPSLSLNYQRGVGVQTVMAIAAAVDYSRTANSALGWYNATTPMPDYYRKMPSYMPQGEVQDYVTDLWRSADADYTQINWGEMVRLNSLSSDGSAFYVVEDKVEKSLAGDFSLVFRSQLSSALVITYGLEASVERQRSYKQMRDLLGATHLLDYDVFIDDSYNKTMPLKNNLLDEDNTVVEGDRFGYDYNINHSNVNLISRVQYRAERFDFDLEATFGEGSFCRVGHFEKERFASNASLGNSATVEVSPYTLRATMGYAAQGNKYLALKVVSTRLSPLANNLFLSAMAANYLSPSLEGESINSAALAFKLNYPSVLLSGEIYALQSRNGSSVYSLYDDLASTMCRASITEIGYSCYGAELTANFTLSSDLKLTSTLASGRYLYDTNPYVELYDDYSLSTLVSPTQSRMEGVNIGNAPQVAATAVATYFGVDHCILTLSSSYSALRYEQPSIVRRSERLFTQAFVNEQSAEAAEEQARLGDVFDVSISASRFFWFEDDSRLTLRISVSNLLSQSDRVIYAKESDRILLQSVDEIFTGATMRESLYQYGTARTLRFSVSYSF